jgi:hypothetical protein
LDPPIGPQLGLLIFEMFVGKFQRAPDVKISTGTLEFFVPPPPHKLVKLVLIVTSLTRLIIIGDIVMGVPSKLNRPIAGGRVPSIP